jgi:hypothetical protein
VAITTAVLCLVCLFSGAGYAAGISSQNASNYNLLVLTPGHSQTITFELKNSLFNETSEFHTLYLMTLGAGTVNVRVGPASAVGEFSGMIYGLVGMIGVTPVIKYAYNAETISISADVPVVGPALLFTGILAGMGSPDFPIVMSMVVTLLAQP